METEDQKRIKELEKKVKELESFTTISFEVEKAFKDRLGINTLKTFVDTLPTDLSNAPQAAITSPTGGVTIDAESRTAINSIITALQTLGLTL